MSDELPQEVAGALEQLRVLIATKLVSQTEIARTTGIDQSQISRILSGHVKRVSRNVLALCKFANEFGSSRENDPSRSAVLMGALRSVWDGSSEHANAIAKVILSLRDFKETLG